MMCHRCKKPIGKDWRYYAEVHNDDVIREKAYHENCHQEHFGPVARFAESMLVVHSFPAEGIQHYGIR
jgi:hypothetical protein